VAVANALQLEAAQATPALSRFNYDTMPSLKSLNLYPLPYYSVFLLLIHYYAVTLTSDLSSWTFAPYRLWRDKACV